MKLDLEAIEQAATAADNGEVLALVELVRRQERELAAARAEQGKPFGYISEASAAMTGKRAIGVRSDPTEASPVPIFLAAPVVAASELSDEQILELDCLRLTHSDDDTEHDIASSSVIEFARRIESAVLAAATPAASLAVPAELTRIGELLRTQDNRITDQPLFIVQQKRRVTGIDPDYCENIVWLNAECEYEEAGEEESARLESEWGNGTRSQGLDGWIRTGYADNWEFVTACFTEQGCKDYLRLDGHNLKETRIYAEGSYRNNEYRAVRNWLMSLPAAPTQAEGN